MSSPASRRTILRQRTFWARALPVTSLLCPWSAIAQDKSEEPPISVSSEVSSSPEEEEDDFDISATSAPESPPPSEPSTAELSTQEELTASALTEESPVEQPELNAVSDSETTPTEEKKEASDYKLPQAVAPGGGGLAPRSLEAEGSNFTRRIRRGLSWWGFVQAQYRTSQISEDQLGADGEPLNENEFGLRRGRLRIDHGWEYAAATLELDASSVQQGLRVGVRRAEASLLYRGTDDDNVTPLLVLTAGVTDVPFGAELGESQRDRVFMERSLGSRALFQSEADLGLKLWGAYRFVNYSVALLNGEPLELGRFPRDPNSAKDFAGRVGAQGLLAETLGLEGGLSFYKGTGFSAGRTATKDSLSWLDSDYNVSASPGEIIGVAGSAAYPSQNFSRWALGLDAALSFRSQLGLTRLTGEVIVASNLDRGLFPSDPVLTGSDTRQTVFTASLIQQLTDFGLLGFRTAFYDPNSDLIEQRAGLFHHKDQSFWALSPVIGLTLPQGRLVAQYDFIFDSLARDEQGVPTDAANNEFTLRLQVDL